MPRRVVKGGNKTLRSEGKLSEQQIEELKRVLNKSPSESGYDHVAWTVKLVWQFIQDAFGVSYAYRYIYRLIKKMGFELAKPYVTQVKRDGKEVEKFEKHVLPAALKTSFRDRKTFTEKETPLNVSLVKLSF